MSDADNNTDDYEVVQVYVGDETTIYYDNDGNQHIVVNDEQNTSAQVSST